MKKQILSVGKALSKAEQKKINGGAPITSPIEKPCIPTVLAPPPPGCNWVRILGTCNYRLVCDDIIAY